jgi:hypothetical protein
MRTLALLAVATLAAFLMVGCFTRSECQLGHASFAWADCVGSCGVADNPMAAGGAHASISISLAGGYAFTTIRSSNIEVASFQLAGSNSLNVDVFSGVAGHADLQLLDAHNQLVDAVTVTVTNTAKLAVTQGWTGTAPLVLEGSTQTFHVTTKDANDHVLVGTGAVDFELADPLRQEEALALGDAIAFSGHAGAGTITARASATTLTQPITIVPLTALTGLTATVAANSSDGSGVYANVDVVANSATGPVYGAPCGWTANDASVVVQSQTTASLESPAKSSTKFKLGLPGSFSATCAIGGVSTTVQLHR